MSAESQPTPIMDAVYDAQYDYVVRSGPRRMDHRYVVALPFALWVRVNRELAGSCLHVEHTGNGMIGAGGFVFRGCDTDVAAFIVLDASGPVCVRQLAIPC